jgi:hypothetical protein
MNDRTKADKAWEARQEAARYRIFNAATNRPAANAISTPGSTRRCGSPAISPSCRSWCAEGNTRAGSGVRFRG